MIRAETTAINRPVVRVRSGHRLASVVATPCTPPEGIPMPISSLLLGVVAGIFARERWSRRENCRLGRLPTVVAEAAVAEVSTAEAMRAARLRQLGEAGTCRVYNCGKILHVDYDRGELIIEREPS